MRTYLLEVTVEAKDEYSEGLGFEPEPELVAATIQDVVVDATRGEYEVGWMVRTVTPRTAEPAFDPDSPDFDGGHSDD